MRSGDESALWLEWMVRVQGPTDNTSVSVSIQAFVHPNVEEEALCLGYMSTFYGMQGYTLTCDAQPYGTGVFLDGSKATGMGTEYPQTWVVRRSGDGGFEIAAASKPDGCARVLATANCSRQLLLLLTEDSSAEYFKSWKFIKRYDIIPPSPPPPPPSPPPVAPLGPVPGPIIAAASSTTSGFVNVAVTKFPQDNRCSASSVVFEYASVTIGAIKETVEVPASLTTSTVIPMNRPGYHTIYAFVKCSSGEVSEQSNGLTVFSEIPDTRPCKETLSPTSDWAIGCGTESCTGICNLFSRVCNVNGARSVDTEAKGAYVAGLFNIEVTVYDSATNYPDAPVIDIEGNATYTETYFFWNGTVSECDVPGLFPEFDQTSYYPRSRRICCCGKSCPVQ